MCCHSFTDWCHVDSVKDLNFTTLLRKGQLCSCWIITGLILSLFNTKNNVKNFTIEGTDLFYLNINSRL